MKVDTRMDNVVDSIRKYADPFTPLPDSAIAVLVTHMDIKVKWTPDDLRAEVNNELGIDHVLFTDKTRPRKELEKSLLQICTAKHQMGVDSELFMRIFKIHNHHRKILAVTRREVDGFMKIIANFNEKKQRYRGNDLVDLFFEFQVRANSKDSKRRGKSIFIKRFKSFSG